MRPCINARFCKRPECDPLTCNDYASSSSGVAVSLILAVLIMAAMACLVADAVTLNISGHSSGSGLQNLSFSGDQLNISILQNLSGWNITMEGGT